MSWLDETLSGIFALKFLPTDNLISHEYPIDESIKAYNSLQEQSLGILLRYPKEPIKFSATISVAQPSPNFSDNENGFLNRIIVLGVLEFFETSNNSFSRGIPRVTFLKPIPAE